MNTKLNRRDFVSKSIWGATASMTLPGFIQQTLFNLDARAQSLPSQGGEGPIILLMEMAGGNDTLNTLIPYTNSIYRDARPEIRLGTEHNILQITG